jgi:hypothetical protein
MCEGLRERDSAPRLCRPREGGDPVSLPAKPLDSRLRGNDTISDQSRSLPR